MSSDRLSITVQFVDSSLSDEEREASAVSLYEQLRSADGDLGEPSRPREPAPPGSKGFGSHVVGSVTALLSAITLKDFFGFLRERLFSREIEIEIEANGKKLKLKARGRDDLDHALAAAQRFVANESST
ncbi:MAG: hypothetical protein H6713_40730 [Myxococcales bacterium]|nr:hypothetical protein [Myxococcales bacterium]MCB9756287.1 hypothetical protein [Myxococcales bacterium]